MAGGGTLQVAVKPKGPDWQISFADTGHGLTQQQLEKVFEPFQEHNEDDTGLGLAIVYQIVQAHEGKIMVRSVPGQGCVFTLHLRRAGTVTEGDSKQRQLALQSVAEEARESQLNHG
jgi:signal transduction histidine kinase